MVDRAVMQKIRNLPIWQGEVSAVTLGGGLTNVNFVVTDNVRQDDATFRAYKYVVRFGTDIPEHHVMRFNELSASRAAHAANLSPEVIYAETGITVLSFIESKTFTPKDVRAPENLTKILSLIRKCHVEMPKHLRGPALIFWVFHVIRDYAATLQDAGSNHINKLPDLIAIANKLEYDAGPFDMVYGHNDLLAANILDDGQRLWLIDWDYAGYNSPLFDLGGLASNNALSADQETWLLENYFEKPLTADLWRRYSAFKCASLLRETMWSMVSETSSEINFDFASYTAQNLAVFRNALNDYSQT